MKVARMQRPRIVRNVWRLRTKFLVLRYLIVQVVTVVATPDFADINAHALQSVTVQMLEQILYVVEREVESLLPFVPTVTTVQMQESTCCVLVLNRGALPTISIGTSIVRDNGSTAHIFAPVAILLHLLVFVFLLRNKPMKFDCTPQTVLESIRLFSRSLNQNKASRLFVQSLKTFYQFQKNR